MTTPSAFDSFSDELDRELAEREKEKFRKLNDDKYRIVVCKKRRISWRRILSRLFGK